jgi:hypothetical protein
MRWKREKTQTGETAQEEGTMGGIGGGNRGRGGTGGSNRSRPAVLLLVVKLESEDKVAVVLSAEGEVLVYDDSDPTSPYIDPSQSFITRQDILDNLPSCCVKVHRR